VLAALLASLLLVTSQARAAVVSPPLQIDPTRSLAEQFGYAPAYTRNVPGFDSEGRAYIRSRVAGQDDTSYVNALTTDGWARFDLIAALRAAYPDYVDTVGAGGMLSARIEFDTQDRAYTVLTIRREEGEFVNVLMYSLDRCRTWRVAELPFGDQPAVFDGKYRGNVACEHFTGHNTVDGPPFIAVWRTIEDWPGSWAARNQLFVLQPYFVGDDLVVPPPVRVTDRFLGMLQAAGDSSFAASTVRKTYFTWTEVTVPGQGGSPVYVAVYDRASGKITSRRMVARAQPLNDCHATPGICLDSTGVLHVVTGAHNQPFRYTHSLAPYDIRSWTAQKFVLSSGYRTHGDDTDGLAYQTYLSFVCDPRDTLHIVFRQSRRGVDTLFNGRGYRALCHQSRPSGGSWSPSTVIATGIRQERYVNYFQRLSISPSGKLFVSFSFFTQDLPETLWPYTVFRQRVVLVSGNGLSWRFATDEDLAPPPPVSPEPAPDPAAPVAPAP